MNRSQYEHRRRELEQRFTYQLAVAVPAQGLGRFITAMSSWCNMRHGPEGWATLHRSERGPEPKDWAVFAFATAEDAAGFRRAWSDHVRIE